jgi:hypothetical protein
MEMRSQRRTRRTSNGIGRLERIRIKGAEAPFIILPATVHPAIYLPAATVQSPVGHCAATVQASIDTITLAVESLRQSVPACCIRPTGLAIEIAIDPVAARVEALLDPITLAIQTRFHAVSGIGQSSAGAQQQPGRNDDTFPYVHNLLLGSRTYCLKS